VTSIFAWPLMTAAQSGQLSQPPPPPGSQRYSVLLVTAGSAGLHVTIGAGPSLAASAALPVSEEADASGEPLEPPASIPTGATPSSPETAASSQPDDPTAASSQPADWY
jgi:hypothetical protein